MCLCLASKGIVREFFVRNLENNCPLSQLLLCCYEVRLWPNTASLPMPAAFASASLCSGCCLKASNAMHPGENRLPLLPRGEIALYQRMHNYTYWFRFTPGEVGEEIFFGQQEFTVCVLLQSSCKIGVLQSARFPHIHGMSQPSSGHQARTVMQQKPPSSHRLDVTFLRNHSFTTMCPPASLRI